MMRILLVQPQANFHHPFAETPSTALLLLGTLAQQYGHEVKILHFDIDQVYLTEALQPKPDILGITCNTFQVKHARDIAKEARGKGVRVVIGGPHALAWNGDIAADEIVIGEGENRWLEILGEKPNIQSVNHLPLPNYDLINFDKFCGIGPVGAIPSTAIMASRGCPFECTFCNTPVFWGKTVRYRDPGKVVDEVEHLHKNYGINEVFFQDDTLNLNHGWAFQIFNGIIERGLNREMLFKIDCRVNEKLVTKAFLTLAAKAGVWNIFYGIESGSQEMLDRMKKGITIAEIKRAVKMTHEAGIETQCSFVVGLPGESLKTLRETDALIHEIKPSKYGWCFFCPFPGTAATKEVFEKGHILLDTDYSQYGYGKVLCRTDALDFEELEAFGGFTRL